MALMDTVRQLMKGRSEAVERGVDAAVGRLGSYGETLSQRAEALKSRARALDDDRVAGAPPPAAPSSAAAPASASPPPPAAPAPIPPTERPSLKGDLVDGEDGPPAG
jgi:hypothetical protein